ncbi:MAG: hypothetical protein N3G78_03105 [Desulfobacterota bacterium]|nr:hypothetical protein [Thermodesulfobacteriota bacterium]
MHLPIALLERKKIQRIIFSVRSSEPQKISLLMEKAYERGGWCFHLPTPLHLRSFVALRESTGDDFLMGFGQIGAESGVSLTGKPLTHFASRMVATIAKSLAPPSLVRKFPLEKNGAEVLTPKEVDRMRFDPSLFDQALHPFLRQEIPFLLIGGPYGDWLLGLGRIDLLRSMVSAIREKGKTPIYQGEWAPFALPKAKPLDVAAFAIPIHKDEGRLPFEETCKLIKKFERPVLGLRPFSSPPIGRRAEGPFSLLLKELKVYSLMVEVASERDLDLLFRWAEKVPSLIPFRRT